MNKPLGKLQLLDLRRIWSNEAADFTPWLAKDENIALLSNALGLELQVEGTEVAAGPYSADILARDTATGEYVVIENQLGKTNHDHLGKTITYAAVLGAATIVWVAPEFTDEHKKALDWLNDNSTDDVSYYGIQPELWQIDNSNPAVRFNVLSRPIEAGRSLSIKKRNAELSETRKLQLEWWTGVREALLATKRLPSVQSPRAQYWYNVALGRTGIVLSDTANTFDNKIGVRLYMRHKYGGESALAQLLESKEEIERQIGEKLLWNPNPDARDKIIAIYHDADINQKDRWSDYTRWIVDMTLKFRDVFGPRVKELDLDSPTDEEPEE